MITLHRRCAAFVRGAVLVPALALAACAAPLEAPRSAAAPPAAAPAPIPAPAPATGPALWRVADADTTIYLFGTVHALPSDLDWYRGPVAQALASAQVLVTEIPPGAMKEPAVQQAFLARAMLPEGKTLRALLTPEQRASFEGALAKWSLPPAAFDRVKPWFAAITLGVLPIRKAGFAMEAGVDQAIEARAGAGKTREALETVEEQLALFDEMPLAMQTAYLASVSKQLDTVAATMNELVAAWARGDTDRLAALMNRDLEDPALAERLLYARNRNWARWIEDRLGRPGTVFVAVGAGHLAGANSVQDYLAKGGVASARVQ